LGEVRRMPELDEEDISSEAVNFNEIGKYTISYTPQLCNTDTSAEFNDYIFSKPEKKTLWQKIVSYLRRR